MSSVRPQDRASLCLFRFSDGRRCLTPRSSRHHQFCVFHARKEAQAKAADDLGNDLSFVFSGEYVSACDLSVALARIIPDVARGHVKPRTATTIAYLAQTLVQTMHLSQNEYIQAFGDNNWAGAIEHGMTENYKHLHPKAPSEPAQLSSPSPILDPPAPTAVPDDPTETPDDLSTHSANRLPDQNGAAIGLDESNDDGENGDENSAENSGDSPDFPEDPSIPQPNPNSKPN